MLAFGLAFGTGVSDLTRKRAKSRLQPTLPNIQHENDEYKTVLLPN
jgi:hypothetical protein